MDNEGRWRSYPQFSSQPDGAELKLGSVFYGAVSRDDKDGQFPWYSKLNGELLGRHATMEEGQERIEWEMCNRVRLMVPAYRALKARRPGGATEDER